MRIEDSVDPTPSTSGNYAEYDVKSVPSPLFGYDEEILTPWAKKRYKLSIDGLHEEILDLYHWLRPNKIETALRYSVYDRVKTVIYEKWKDFDIQVSVFGSLRTNLFLPTSDIDVLVECLAWKDVIPILNVKQEFPVVEPLILILKQFLIQRNLNQTFTGGLSSYGLILMLISFLQIYALPVRSKSFYDEGVNLGELLMRFFEVYAQEFNYLEVGISVEDFKYRKKNNNTDFKSPVLSLEDPLLRSNEVGRSTFNFAGVQAAFAQALQVLKGVFVRDRRRNADFNGIVFKRGSILAYIMPFTPQQVEYRCWLKVRAQSQSFSQRPPPESKRVEKVDKMRTPLLITNTCISPYINLETVSWNHPPAIKTSKPLSILPPSSEKKKEATVVSLDEKSGPKDSKDNKRVTKQQIVRKKEPDYEKENNEKHIKKLASPRKEDALKKETKGKKVTDSLSYSSAVYRNPKKQGDTNKSEKVSSQSNTIASAKKSESDTTNGVRRSSGLDTRKPERRPDIEIYNPAARSHRNHTPKTNGNVVTAAASNSDADSEQDGGFTVVKSRGCR